MSTAAIPIMTVEEYLAADETSEEELEFLDGRVFPLAVASLNHAKLQLDLGTTLSSALQGKPCTALSTMRVRISPSKFLKPDLIVFCGRPSISSGPDGGLTNPKVIFEVLSPSTEGYDYGVKRVLYFQLSSLEEYVLVAQDQPRIEVYRRSTGNSCILTTYEGVDAAAVLESIGVSLPLSALYAGLPEATQS